METEKLTLQLFKVNLQPQMPELQFLKFLIFARAIKVTQLSKF